MLRYFILFVALAVSSSSTMAQEPNDIFAANKRLGRGINLGNALEPPRGANWGVVIEDEYFAAIKKAGFDSIRIPVRWNDYADKNPPYTIEKPMFEKVDHFLDLAEKQGLNVVLNIHHYDELDKDPDNHTARFEALWKQLGEHYRSRSKFLYFELDNEPHDQLIDDKWNEVLLKGLASVRQSNPTRPVIIGPPFWNGIWALPKLKLPSDPNLIVTVHFYNPFEFTHQGASWAEPKVRDLKNVAWTGNKEELDKLRSEFDQAANWGKTNNRPIYVGEFGAFEMAPMESRVRWTQAVARECEARGFSWAYWELCAGFGVYDPVAKNWRKPLLDALVPSK